MNSFIIDGGHKLSGEITPQGAKNEALEVTCATLLTSEKVTIHNIPDILDITNLILLMKKIGVKVERLGSDTYSFQADSVDTDCLRKKEVLAKNTALRGSIMLT